MAVFRAMGILTESPWLAAVPMLVFFALFAYSKRRLILAVALLWLAYLPYEYGMKLRILCSGECNIRLDLILIFPVLLVSSLMGLLIFGMSSWKTRRAATKGG